MNLRSFFVPLFLLSLAAAASIQNENNQRSKRTLHYFLDGLFSMLNQERKQSAKMVATTKPSARSRVSIDQNISSPFSMITKLSAISTQPRKSNAVDDDDDDDVEESKPTYTNYNSYSRIQIPIPTTSTTSAPAKVPNFQTDGPTKVSLLTTVGTSTTEKSDSFEVSSEKTEEYQEDDRVPIETTSKIDEEETYETSTMEPDGNETSFDGSLDGTSTVEPCLNTDSPEMESTTHSDVKIDEKHNNVDTDDDDSDEKVTERPLTLGRNPARTSGRHTTQFFGSPLIVERHPDEQHSPMYYENCGEVNCMDDAENSKEVRPYIVPQNFQQGTLLVIPIGFAVPHQIRKIAARSSRMLQNSNYGYYTLHQNPQPIWHLHQPRIQFYTARNS